MTVYSTFIDEESQREKDRREAERLAAEAIFDEKIVPYLKRASVVFDLMGMKTEIEPVVSLEKPEGTKRAATSFRVSNAAPVEFQLLGEHLHVTSARGAIGSSGGVPVTDSGSLNELMQKGFEEALLQHYRAVQKITPST